MAYNCFEFDAEKTRLLVEEHQSIAVARKKRLTIAIDEWEKESGKSIPNESSIENFFNVYRTAYDFDEYPKEAPSPGNSELRKELCDHCQAIKCGACSKDKRSSTLSCETCKNNPDTWKNPPKQIGDRCFLNEEFQKVRLFEMKSRNDKFDPRDECHKCVSCTATDDGEEKIDLKDIPLDGYPTIVTVYRKIYKRNNSPCPKICLPGLQNSSSCTYTIRLHKAVSDISLGSARPKISEWFNISRNTLNSMITRQARVVEEKKAALRRSIRLNACRALFTIGHVKDETCIFYFVSPATSSRLRDMELVGIYSERELDYLKSVLVDNGTGERPSSLTNTRVYSMAFDYACRNLFGPPAVFASLTAMADLFYCNPVDGMRESFWVLYFRMMDALKKSEPIGVLLDILRSLRKLFYGDDAYLALYESARELYNQVSALNDRGDDLSFLGLRSFDEDKKISAIGITDMISACSEETDMTFDEIRDRILFFNQAVVPYRYNRSTGETAPMFSEDGLIKTSHITSLGIPCPCLERLAGSGLLMDDMEGSLCCKEYSFHGKTWIDLEESQGSACALCECQNLYEYEEDSD